MHIATGISAKPNHAIWINKNLRGVAYGSLRALEQAIIRRYSAIPIYGSISRFDSQRLSKYLGLGTNKSKFRPLLPRKHYKIDADIFWTVLMGPENFEFDINHVELARDCFRILYIFDTFPGHLDLVSYITSCFHFDLLICSFREALKPLGQATGRLWIYVPQGVPDYFLADSSNQKRNYDFASFGRKNDLVDAAIKKFCHKHDLTYITTDTTPETDLMSELERYHHYACILKNSIFNVCWSVSDTHPSRSAGVDPITARWFEATAAGNVILGSAPSCNEFSEELAAKCVHRIDGHSSLGSIVTELDQLWSNSKKLSLEAHEYSVHYGHQLTWDARLDRIEGYLNLAR